MIITLITIAIMSKSREKTESVHTRPDTVSDAFGQKVYTDSGVYLGRVEDVRVNFNEDSATGIALTDVNPEVRESAGSSGDGVVIPYSWVKSVHDVVVTINIVERLQY